MQDNEIRQKKEACYTDVEKYVLRSCALCCFLFGGTHLTRCFCLCVLTVVSLLSRLGRSGLWGWACRSSPTEKENCVLRCLSPECYDLIYGGDPVSGGM